MRVRDLIVELNKLDPDAEVTLFDLADLLARTESEGLLVEPPWTAEEWKKVRVEDFTDPASALSRYVQDYRAAVSAYDPWEFLRENGINDADLKNDAAVRSTLQRVWQSNEISPRNTEVLLVLSFLVRFLHDAREVRLEKTTLAWLERVEGASQTRLCGCLRQHYACG